MAQRKDIERAILTGERERLEEFLKKVREEWKEKEQRKLRLLRNEAAVWKYINKKRGRKRWIENDISTERWEKHFGTLLEGRLVEETTEEDAREDMSMCGLTAREEETSGQVQDGMEIEKGEILAAVKGLRTYKAAGYDGIPAEAWLYGEIAVRKGLTDVIRQVWNHGKLPLD